MQRDAGANAGDICPPSIPAMCPRAGGPSASGVQDGAGSMGQLDLYKLLPAQCFGHAVTSVGH